MNNKDVITGSFVNEQIYSKEYNNIFYDFIKHSGLNFTLTRIKNIYKYKNCSCNSIDNDDDDNNYDYYLSNNWTFRITKELLNLIIKKVMNTISKKLGDESLKYYKEIYINNYSYLCRKQLFNDTKKINEEIHSLIVLGLQLERIYDIMEQKKNNSNSIYYIPEDDYLDEWKELNLSRMQERTEEVFLNYENVDGRTNKNVQETLNG